MTLSALSTTLACCLVSTYTHELALKHNHLPACASLLSTHAARTMMIPARQLDPATATNSVLWPTLF